MRKTLAALTAVVSISLLSGCGSSDSSPIPSALTGEWHQTNTSSTGMNMVAEISENEIKIDVVSRDDSMVYWMGSFDTDKRTSSAFKTVSLADPDAKLRMNGSIFGSSDNSKVFAYKNGVLSFVFKFGAAGIERTIKLEKNPLKITQGMPSSAITVSVQNAK